MVSDAASVLWRRLDRPGHETASVRRNAGGWELAGAAVFLDVDRPVRLDYHIDCAGDWTTRGGVVTGWIGSRAIFVRLEADAGAWKLNGEPQPDVRGCIDLDLNFSPATNLLPIRRLDLAVGERADVRAAWLRFPNLQLEPLAQAYVRTGESTYRYESATGFTADLRVDENGFVVDYPGGWVVESVR
ncbi:MAG: putative glycolipid-binding domain-containing protein [Thermoanaerobaculia bacterium]